MRKTEVKGTEEESGGGGVNISGFFFLLTLIYRIIFSYKLSPIFFPSFIIGVSSSKFSDT